MSDLFHWRRAAPWHLGAVDRTDRPRLLEVWEAAVRTTHHFLAEEDIQFYRGMLGEQYFDLVRLTCLRDAEGAVQGFSGTAEDRLEMLFVDPAAHGRGFGKALLHDAIERHGVRLVDVNEQNREALGFYISQGFERIGRSPLDGADRPFPLLHLRLRETA
jgi:putative acetyltransferase